MEQDVRRSAEELEKNASTLLVAVSCHDVFIVDDFVCEAQTDSSPLPKGTAFPFIKAVQAVNERLISLNKNETLLFEVIMLGKDYNEYIKTKITQSTTHYGLEVGKCCFCPTADFIKTLQVNCIKLLLSTDRDDIHGALQAGVPAALLYKHETKQVVNQLKVLFSGDLIGLPGDPMDCLNDLGISDIQNFKAAKACIREFAVLIGEMRKKLGCEDSPIHTSLMTVYGSREVCATALKTLRSWGVDVDEAYCLAGAPHSLILSVLQPHILWDDGLQHITCVKSHEGEELDTRVTVLPFTE